MTERPPLLFQRGFTKSPREIFEPMMGTLEYNAHGSWLLYLLIRRETLGRGREWSPQLSVARLSQRLGWGETSVKKMLAVLIPDREEPIQSGLYFVRRPVDVTIQIRGGRQQARATSYRYALTDFIPIRRKHWTAIWQIFVDDFVPYVEQRRRGAMLVFFLIWHYTVGKNNAWAVLSESEIAGTIGWSYPTVRRIMKWLKENTTLIVCEEMDGARNRYQANQRIVEMLTTEVHEEGETTEQRRYGTLPRIQNYVNRDPGVVASEQGQRRGKKHPAQ